MVKQISTRWAIKVDMDKKTVLFLDRKYTDPSYPGWENGQPTYSYYISTILQHNGKLCLDMSIPAWTVPAEDMAIVRSELAAL